MKTSHSLNGYHVNSNASMTIRLYRGDILIKEFPKIEDTVGTAPEVSEGIADTEQLNSNSKEQPVSMCEYLRPIDYEDNVSIVKGQSDDFISQLTEGHTLQKGNIELDCSGTGTGKTTHILEKVIPYAAENGMHILYVAPRKMILSQITQKLRNKANRYTVIIGAVNDDERDSDDDCSDYIGIQTFYFANSPTITVMSAQKLYYELIAASHKKRDCFLLTHKIHIVVFDEIHSILDDSVFSEPMNFVLDKMLHFFKIRVSYIFMSATMEGVDRVIYESAQSVLKEIIDTPRTVEEWVENDDLTLNGGHGFERLEHDTGEWIQHKFAPLITKYVIPTDYSNYKVNYMMNEEEDIASIYNYLPKNRKLLVFVTSIQKGEELHNRLLDSVLIFSEENSKKKLSDAARTELKNIRTKEKFDCKCLITTKVLDAGVNLHDDYLCDIVVLCDEKNEFIQCLGRRRNISRSTVTLYIPARNAEYFSGKANSCRKKLEASKSLEKCLKCREKYCKCDTKNFFETYLTDPNKLSDAIGMYACFKDSFVVLPMAKIKMSILKYSYDQILARFQTEGEKAFILEQLSWLGLEDTYSEDNWYNQDTKPDCPDDLISLLEENRIIDGKDNITNFRWKADKIFKSLKWYNTRSENPIGISKTNSILKEKEVPYTIVSDKAHKHQWIVKKV